MENRNKLGQFIKGHKFWLLKKRPNISKEKNYNWKGGIIVQEGYRYILKPDHPRAKSKKGYVAEHVLVMEKKLGRYLEPEEVVHHKNGNRIDNRIKNLRLCKNISEHNKIHKPKSKYLNTLMYT